MNANFFGYKKEFEYLEMQQAILRAEFTFEQKELEEPKCSNHVKDN